MIQPVWPHESIFAEAPRQGGWRPTPLREFALKIYQGCNLACDYCYVYNMVDQSWRRRPVTMSLEIVSLTARRIAEHAERHGLREVYVIFHGGEPLLVGAERIAEIVETIRVCLSTSVRVHFAVQTNGTLLNQGMLPTLASQGIRIGVSLDGTAANHNKHRPYVNGRGSFDSVRKGLELLAAPEYRHLYSGLLTVVDPSSVPEECYEQLLEFNPPALDLLLPHANWSNPQPAGAAIGHSFGKWLIRIFDRWYDAPRKETRIRLFDEIVHTVLGGRSRSSDIGLSPSVLAVVESDGSIEQSDILKSAYEGAPATGLSVWHDQFDDALAHPGFIARQIGWRALGTKCRKCEINEICGGGQYPHRFRRETGFGNPSVYCRELGALIDHIRQRVLTDPLTRAMRPERP